MGKENERYASLQPELKAGITEYSDVDNSIINLKSIPIPVEKVFGNQRKVYTASGAKRQRISFLNQNMNSRPSFQPTNISSELYLAYDVETQAQTLKQANNTFFGHDHTKPIFLPSKIYERLRNMNEGLATNNKIYLNSRGSLPKNIPIVLANKLPVSKKTTTTNQSLTKPLQFSKVQLES